MFLVLAKSSAPVVPQKLGVAIQFFRERNCQCAQHTQPPQTVNIHREGIRTKSHKLDREVSEMSGKHMRAWRIVTIWLPGDLPYKTSLISQDVQGLITS